MDNHYAKRPVAETGRFFVLLFSLMCSAVLLPPGTCYAGNFDVQPVRISFTAKTRVGKLVVRNLTAGELIIQAKAFKWVEGSDGKDVYEDTPDILIFPRVVKIPRGGQRLLRLGTTVGPAIEERTYRVYIEELPLGEQKTGSGEIRFTLKIGIPVFISPLKTKDGGVEGSLTMEGGKAVVQVRNSGNCHLVIESIAVTGRDYRGEKIFSKNLTGWYLLGGASRKYATQIPPALCAKLSTIQTMVRTTRNSLEKTMQVTGGMCGPRTR